MDTAVDDSSNSALPLPQISCKFNPFDQSDTYRTKESESSHQSNGDIDNCHNRICPTNQMPK